MNRLSPKTEIINHFDNLINRIDIDIGQSIEKFKEDQMLGELKCFPVENRRSWKYNELTLKYLDSNETSENNNCEEVIEWSESTKVIDYLTQIRQRTIDELRKVQEDSLEYLKSKSCDLNQLRESKDDEEMKSLMFAEKFYFQVFYKHQDSWVFNLYTIIADFYLSQSDINFLERLINFEEKEKYQLFSNSSLILDEKFLLINSMARQICDKVKTQQYPSHVIRFCKQDLLNIKAIQNLSSLYNLNQVRIEGLSSVVSLVLQVKRNINNDWLTKLFEAFPYIEDLTLRADFSNINFDSFANLKKLILIGNLFEDFTFDVFKNICNQLEELSIRFFNMNNANIYELLYRHHFPNLIRLEISSSKITILGNLLYVKFPMLQCLIINDNSRLETIDKRAFVNLNNLRRLVLVLNRKLTENDPELFSHLENLEELHLNSNRLRHFDLKIMDYIPNIKEITLSGNRFVNKKEIMDYFKESKIKHKV